MILRIKNYSYICKKEPMRKLFFILSIIPFITSCLKYSQPKSLSLSGLYVIDKITTNDSIYTINEVFYDSSDLIVPTLEDTPYIIGDTLCEIDYSTIRLNPIQGGLNWSKEYFYWVHGQRTAYDLGYIKFNCEGTSRTWKILDDSDESLTIRIQPNQNDEWLVLSLTRIGP
jgi:hypothetical protein